MDFKDPYHSVLVADTGNNRLLWLRLYADVNQDGIDDVWTSYYFDGWYNGVKYPLEKDRGAQSDPDGDGLVNIGEYHAGTNPHDPNTKIPGISDQWYFYNPGKNPAGIPKIISVTASTNLIHAGESVILTVTFDRDVTGFVNGANPNLNLILGNGGFDSGDLALSGVLGTNVYTFVFTAHKSSPIGWVDAEVSNAQNKNAPHATIDPLRREYKKLFYIEEAPVEIEEPDPEHEGPLIITEFGVRPLRIRWTSTPDVKYWIITTTELSDPVSEWEYVHELPFIGPPAPADEMDSTGLDFDDLGLDPARFFMITTEPNP